jgi:hypothetical protein
VHCRSKEMSSKNQLLYLHSGRTASGFGWRSASALRSLQQTTASSRPPAPIPVQRSAPAGN